MVQLRSEALPRDKKDILLSILKSKNIKAKDSAQSCRADKQEEGGGDITSNRK